MKKYLKSFSVLEFLFIIIVGSFFVFTLSSLSLDVFNLYRFQKKFQETNIVISQIRQQIINHLTDAFYPSLTFMPNSIQWKRYIIKYPIILEATNTQTRLIGKNLPHSLKLPQYSELFCINDYSLHKIISLESSVFSLASPASKCTLAYIINAKIHTLNYSDTIIDFGHTLYKVEHFAFMHNKEKLTFSLCVQQQCIEWVLFL